MVVCSCRAVSDGTVREAIDAGAQTVEELQSQCQAATGCGGCWPTLQRLLDESRSVAASAA